MPQQSGTEFFTMFGTMMDNKPLSPSSAEPEPPLAADDAKSAASSFSPASLPSSPPPSLATTGARRKSTLRDFFVGPDGIYAIPRWLIYLAIAFVIFQMEVWLLARRAFGRNFWVGTLWGIVSLSVLMLALRIAGAFEFGVLELHGARIWKFALYYAVLFLLTAFFEDFLMRGYSQWVLSRGMNFWPAAALLSFAFGYIHAGNPGEAKTGLVAGRRLSHGMGLGRKLSVLRSRQRAGSARASAQLQFAWSRLAHGRLSRARGKLPRILRV